MTEEQQLKLEFAEAWLKNPRNAFKAALTLTNGDTFLAMNISRAWTHDPEVAQFKKELLEEKGEDYFLPSRAEMVRETWERATSSDNDEFVKLTRLAADMRGFIEKPGVTVNNNHLTNNKVMIVPIANMTDSGTVDAVGWEQQALEQQQGLMGQNG